MIEIGERWRDPGPGVETVEGAGRTRDLDRGRVLYEEALELREGADKIPCDEVEIPVAVEIAD